MSLINNVLRGLDSKPSAFTPLQIDRVNTLEKPLRAKRWVYLLLVIAALLGCAYLIYSFSSQVPQEKGQSGNAELPAAVVVAEPARFAVKNVSHKLPEPELIKETLSGLQINENTNFLELSLRLAEGAQSVLSSRAKNRYVFLISQSTQNIVVPEFSQNKWLRQISLTQVTNGFELEFVTPDGVLVETQHQFRGADNYWIIRLKKTQQKKSGGQALKLTAPLEKQRPSVAKVATSTPVTEVKKAAQVNVAQVKLDITPVKTEISDRDRLYQAQSFMKQHDWKPAEELLKQLLGSPVDISARINLLKLYQYQQKNKPMNELLSSSLRLYPTADDFKVIDAQLLFDQQDYQGLITRYQTESFSRDVLNLVA
ncbi:MAG: hypothetical protein ISR73_10035, partial [Gammaproteobacteria bacterium]|nr:hypothetical protein [Gammaproteobacteria bacterium]